MSRLHRFSGRYDKSVYIDIEQVMGFEEFDEDFIEDKYLRVFLPGQNVILEIGEKDRLLEMMNKPKDQNIWSALSYNARRLTEIQQQIDELHALCAGDVVEDDERELPLPRPDDGNVRISLEIPEAEAREVVDLLMKWKLDIEPVDVDEVVKRLEETQVMVKSVMNGHTGDASNA